MNNNVTFIKNEMINEGKHLVIVCEECQGKAREFVEFNKMNDVDFRPITHVSKTFFNQDRTILEEQTLENLEYYLSWIRKMVVIYENDFNAVKEQYDEDLKVQEKVKRMSPATQEFKTEMLDTVKKFLTNCDNKKEIEAVLNANIDYLRNTLIANGLCYE
jgi:hypothetical protein